MTPPLIYLVKSFIFPFRVLPLFLI
ncbi:hypothetical protein LINPERHAP2_LOCUS23435, partial [Linum perenne]